MEQETRRALQRAHAADARPWRARARQLGPSPEDIRAICTEYQSAEVAYATTERCGSAARVREACKRYVRAQIALEAIGDCMPVTRQSMAVLSAAEYEYTTRQYSSTLAREQCLSILGVFRERMLDGVQRDLALDGAALTRCAVPRRPAHRQQSRQRSRAIAVAKSTVGGDSGDDDGEPPGDEPPGSRRIAIGGAP